MTKAIYKLNRYTRMAGLSVVLLLSTQHLVQAQVLAPELAAKEAQPASSQWGLGIGAGYTTKAYRDFDNKVSPLPLVLYENRYISFFGTTLDAKLPSAGPVSFRLRAKYSMDGYEAKDSPFLSGMEERKGGCGWVARRSGEAISWMLLSKRSVQLVTLKENASSWN